MNGGGHDADLAFAGRDNSRAVRPNQPRTPVLQELPRLHHIERWDTFRDADDQIDFRVGGFHDCVSRKRWRNKNHGSISARLLDSVANRIENGPAFMRRTAFARRDSANDLGPIRRAGLRMECAFTPGESLNK